jgi:hypothetical protein
MVREGGRIVPSVPKEGSVKDEEGGWRREGRGTKLILKGGDNAGNGLKVRTCSGAELN